MPDSKELFSLALRLPRRERAELAAQLIASLEKQRSHEDVDEAWAREIQRRCAAVDAGQAVTSGWNEFRQRIEREIFGR